MTRRGVLREADVRERLAAACMAAGGQRRFAERAGLSEGYVSRVRSGKLPAGEGVLRALGLQQDERTYVQTEAVRG